MAQKNTIDKDSIIKDFKLHDSDTGSSEVQIALLTARIKHLTEHLRENRKDFVKPLYSRFNKPEA